MIAGRVVTAIDGWGGDTPTNPNEHATGVRVGAFEDCTDVKSVTIPKSVKSIDKHAFGYNDIEDKPLNEIKILCYADSYAEKFAKDEDFDYSIIAHENHDYTYTVVRPTYSSTGYTICQCEICGDWYKTDPKDKLVLGSVSNIKSNPTFNSVKLSWDKVNNADGYIVYKYDNAKKNWIRVAKTQMAKNSYTVSKLNASTAYKFAVKAYKTVNGKELTSPSYPTAQVVTRPGVVSGFKAASNSTNSVKLSWNKTVRADGYIVYRYDYNKKTWIRLTKTSGTNYTATGLASGTSYKFAVKAYNTINGKEWGGSSLTQLNTSTTPDKVNFTVKSPSAGRATLSWSKVRGATGYIVYYKENAKDSWHRLTVTNGTSYTKTGLKRGNNYIFTVKAYRNACGKTFNGAFVNKALKIK